MAGNLRKPMATRRCSPRRPTTIIFTRLIHGADLSASGMDVGLPEGQMGNSEVGHLNLGAGRIVYQDFTRINKAILDGELATNPVIRRRLNLPESPGSISSGCFPMGVSIVTRTI